MPKFKYNAGDKLGPLNILLIERTTKNPDGTWKGRFQCPYCDMIFETKIKNVVSGGTKSCGCLQKENGVIQGRKNHADLLNQRFGRLKVIKLLDKRTNSGNCIWLCQCDCGNTKEVATPDLKTGKVKSCGCLNSHGEAKIKSCLDNLNIKYYTEHIFENCYNPATGISFRFDFYLPDYNCCIEYDGIQHFETHNYGWDTSKRLKKTQLYDKMKTDYCSIHNIKLIRIKYTDLNLISEKYLVERINS